MQITNLTNPGVEPVTGDQIEIAHPNGAIERKQFTAYVAPLEPIPELPPVWEWFIDHGPWADRLGMAAMAIDISTLPELVAIRSDTARRKWVDMKDPRTVGVVWFLAGVEHPMLGTLATPLLTAEEATLALNTKPTKEDNLALRRVYFS